MRRALVGMALLAASAATAQQPFNDVLVQPPELKAPQRGSLAGQYARTAFGPADVSRGGFSLTAPFSVPQDRGPLLAGVFPVYSPDGGLSEWGLGWQASLALTRTRVLGELDYATDELTGPWGRLARGTDGRWYPQGMKGAVRVEAGAGDTYVASLPDGSKWTFGGAARVLNARGTYAWYLTQVETATGRKTRLDYVANASGRLFLQSASYGGVGDDFQYRVDVGYDMLAAPFVDYRSGAALELDRRVAGVTVSAKNAATGAFAQRWRYALSYTRDEQGPAFWLSSVQQTFASGQQPPAVTYSYESAASTLQVTAPRRVPAFDAVLTDYSEAVAQPTRSTPVDSAEDGRVDLESREDFSLIVQGDTGFTYQPLPPAPADADPLCRPSPSPDNRPRQLARMRAADSDARVVALTYQPLLGQTDLVLCQRDGKPLYQTRLWDEWELGATRRLVDLNRDRQPDLLQVYWGGYQVVPNVSTPAGYAFGAPVTGSLQMDFDPQALWVHDFNGDTVPDLVLRQGSNLVVYAGKGQFQFEQVPVVYPAESWGMPVDLAGYELTFVEANGDGLSDVLINNAYGMYLLVNAGDRLVEREVPGLAMLGPDAGFPVVQDLAGSGNPEVFFTLSGQAHSLALGTAGTGLLREADDGRGTRLTFQYARGPAAPGLGQRGAVLDSLKVEASGRDAVTHRYTYGGPRVHSVGHFLLGYGEVTRQDLHVQEAQTFLHEDGYTGVLLASRTHDDNTPLVEAFTSEEYDDASFQGIAWKRPRAEVRGVRSADGTQSVSERIEHLSYVADVCPAVTLHTSAHGTLRTERTRSTPTGLANALHCLDGRIVHTGTHPDSTLDFRHEGVIERNSAGLVTAVSSVSGGATQTLQQVVYNPDFTVAQVSSPGRGMSTYGYEAGSRLLRQVTAPDGVISRVTARDGTTDGILGLEVDRGGMRVLQSFWHDGQERLGKQWDSFGGTELNPRQTFAYREATATQPANIFISTLVDSRSGAASDSVEYFAATGDGVAVARRVPEGWSFQEVKQQVASLSEDRVWMRPGMAATVDVLALDYAALFSGARQVASRRTSAVDEGDVASTTTFHEGVERQVATSLGLEAGQLTQTVLENGTLRTRRTLDASHKLVAYEDEAATRYGYRYDALGRLRQVDLPDGKKHRVSYDGHGRVSLLEREGLARVQYTYDATTGLLSTKSFALPTGAVQRQVTFAYDSAGRVSTETYSDATSSQVYRYWRDGAAPAQPTAQTARGLLTAVEGDGFLKTFEYRADGKLTRRVVRLNGWRDVETQRTYADDGEVATETQSVRAADGTLLASSTQEHRWDSYGRVAESWLNGALMARYGYDANGQLASVSFAQGGSVQLGYDAVSRRRVSLQQVTPAWSAYTDLRLNNRGFIDSETFTVGAKSLKRTYGYSPEGFLASASDADSAYGYTFDRFGLPTSIQTGSTRQDVVAGNGTLTVGGVVYTFDGLGRTSSRGDLTFQYGPHGHLAKATRAGTEWRFVYDEAGQRLLKSQGTAPLAAYLDDGAYLDATGLTVPFRVGDQVVGTMKAGAFQMLAADVRGSLIGEANGTMRLGSPFGDRGVRPATAAVLDYVQKGYDADLGVIRMGVRDYDPKLHRFLTPDPLYLEEPGRCATSPVECNLYGYARSEPVAHVDDSGQDAVYIAFPDYKIDTGTPIGKVGGLGHAGVLLINNKTGSTRYYEYGRYDKAAKGMVKRRNVPDVKMGKDGRPTKESLNATLRAVSKEAGHGTRIEGAYVPNDDFEKMKDYADKRMAQNNDPKREAYKIMSNNCATFAKETIEAGGADMPRMIDPRPNSYVEEVQDDYTKVTHPGSSASSGSGGKSSPAPKHKKE